MGTSSPKDSGGLWSLCLAFSGASNWLCKARDLGLLEGVVVALGQWERNPNRETGEVAKSVSKLAPPLGSGLEPAPTLVFHAFNSSSSGEPSAMEQEKPKKQS